MERATERDHHPHAGGHADKQKEHRPQADADGTARIGVAHSGVNTQDGHEQVDYGRPADQVEQVFATQRPLEPQVRAQDHRQQHHFLGVVKHAAELAEHELLGRQVGHQEHVERPAVAFGGQRSDRLGIDQHQAQHPQRHEHQGTGGQGQRFAGQHFIQRIARQPDECQIAEADDQHAAAVGPGTNLAPQDRVVPHLADFAGGRVNRTGWRAALERGRLLGESPNALGLHRRGGAGANFARRIPDAHQPDRRQIDKHREGKGQQQE